MRGISATGNALVALGFLLLAMTTRSSGQHGPTPEAPEGWRLVWHDEFDGDTVDDTRWRVEDAALVKNNELQYYAPDEVYLEDGCLVLRSRQRAMGNREFTSGLIESRGRFAQAFGRIEIRAKLPRTQGMWPAHWMLPEDRSWPPEIDIMESVGSQPELISMSLHTGAWPDLDSQTMDHLGPDYSADFHVFALEWDPDELRWYIDGTLAFSTRENVPQKPFFIILNTAIGGNMPGDPDETTEWPQHHRIDYVRVYARDVRDTFFLTTATRNGRVVVTPRDRENRYKKGSAVTLKAVPSIGYRFSRWSGGAEGEDNPAEVVMDADRRVVAHFVPDPDAPLLLSRGRKAAASSMENDNYPPENAVDGDRKTRWSSEFSDQEWITVDLGAPHRIDAVRLDWEAAHARDYRLDVSQDGRTWQNIHAKSDGHGGVEQIININTTGRFVRMDGIERAREWGYSLWEFEVYGR